MPKKFICSPSKRAIIATKLFALVALAVIIAAVVFTYDFTVSHVKVHPNAARTSATTPTEGPSNNLTYVAVYNNNIFIVTGQQFSAVKVLNRTFVRGGPIMVGPNAEFVAEIYSPALVQELRRMGQVLIVIYVGGAPVTLTLPVKVLSSPLEPTAVFYPPTGPIPM